jgi:hypothetical protein
VRLTDSLIPSKTHPLMVPNTFCITHDASQPDTRVPRHTRPCTWNCPPHMPCQLLRVCPHTPHFVPGCWLAVIARTLAN